MLTIDWTQAPEWANFAAMDYDGEWWWYENKPQKSAGGNHFADGMFETFIGDDFFKRPTPPATLNNMDNY